jgi:hypothetical protein
LIEISNPKMFNPHRYYIAVDAEMFSLSAVLLPIVFKLYDLHFVKICLPKKQMMPKRQG